MTTAAATTTDQRNRFNEQKTIAVHVRSQFWYIALPSSAKQQREMTKFERTWAQHVEHLIFFLNLNAAPTNLVPG